MSSAQRLLVAQIGCWLVVQLVLMLTVCGISHVQAEEATASEAPGENLPLWLPNLPVFPGHPVTDAEFDACLRRMPKTGAHEHPAAETPPAPRCLLKERVSVDVKGTVVEAMKALMEQPRREWLMSIRGDSAGKMVEFVVKDAPLWQALDKLLEAYGYDWGYSPGAVVCWPALIPTRERAASPSLILEAEDAPATAQPIEIAEPTPVEDVLACFRRKIGKIGRRPAVDARLCDWQLVRRMAGGNAARDILQMAAALTAVVQGEPVIEGCISVGAHMWPDRAMRGADAREAELKAEGTDLSVSLGRALPLKDTIRALLSAQQWRSIELGGQAVIWLRAVPLEGAELWVVVPRAGEVDWVRRSADGKDRSVDWSRPEEFYATATRYPEGERGPIDHLWRVVGHHLAISVAVMTKRGVRIGM